MKVPDDVICHVCKKIFCCSECRQKHEIKNHSIAEIVLESNVSKAKKYLMCPICEEKPLLLKSEMNIDLLKHIEQKHLPLQCQKCFKLYAKIEDLREFSKCFQPQECCYPQKQANEEKIIQNTIATQTSPLILEGKSDSRYITPISIINLRWKAQSKVTHEEFVTDSVSSIKNVSSINNSSTSKSTGICKGKIVRSTSTPLHAELFISKTNEQVFSGSTSGHMSSIYNSACDSDASNQLSSNPPRTPSKQTMGMNHIRKVGGRTKMSAVTPLRQVMSKSIQKAFAEHGLTKAIQNAGSSHIHKNKFEKIENSLFEHHTGSGINSPLDLRLSPALRRSQSEPNPNSNSDKADLNSMYRAHVRHKILLSSKKTTTTESFVITSSTQHLGKLDLNGDNGGNGESNCIARLSEYGKRCPVQNISSSSLYQTCSSVKIIHTSTELSALDIKENAHSNNHVDHRIEEPYLPDFCAAPKETIDIRPNEYADHTPTTRIKGSIIKEKLIKFDTPKLEDYSVKVLQKENSTDDLFFTPESIPLRKSWSREVLPKGNKSAVVSHHPRLHDCAQILSFNHVQEIDNSDSDNANDDVFLPETNFHNNADEVKEKPLAAYGSGLWSFMSTAIKRIPSFKGEPTTKQLERSGSFGLESCSKSILKRCASIAGSIVRSKALIAEEQIKPLKRKRTYTMDSQSTTYSTNNNCSESSTIGYDLAAKASSKRFRIQARKPIDRMRINS